jgi:transcription initiation factor TFIID subunit 2
MTIRIHEADGTPYEHIVEIKDAVTKLEIPYNTKYKRLKRSRRQKERHIAEGATGEEGGDSLLYCLGDILDSEEEKREWNLMDWTTEDEEKMGQEHYEWIRMDADFEWIGSIQLVMPLYMYVSQLQQDRDIVAQYESLRYLLASNPHHVSLTILIRTLMDKRYFWGIREMAAAGLSHVAKDRLVNIGQFHLMKAFRQMFCMPDTNMPKSNDFSDRRDFLIQCAIPRSLAKLRDDEGKVPMTVRRFLVDLLKFNDNSNNFMEDGEALYSDNHYVATLMNCLTDSLVASHRVKQPTYTFSFGGEDEPMDDDDNPDADFAPIAIAQIERHRSIDEFESSYQNIYSITALECLQRLSKAGVAQDKKAELMKYVRKGNATNVRLTAWRCLSEVGILRGMKSMRYLLHCLQEDPSPEFRYGLLAVFGEALGHIALGDPEPERVAPPPATDGLVLEQEASNEARRVEATRKTTPEGALVALKNTLQNEGVFAEALWYAVTSPDITLDETAALCDIAALIYEPIVSLRICLRLPRMWSCTHEGEGKMRFVAYGRYRSVPRKPLTTADWELLKRNGLDYTGPVEQEVEAIRQRESQTAVLQQQIQFTQQELMAAQSGHANGPMPPPAMVTPATERSGFRLNLAGAGKRKASVDLGARAGSPKAQKSSRQQSPAGSVASAPKSKASPARRSSTPNAKGAGKAKKSKIATLRFAASGASRAKQILSAPPQSQSQRQPSLPITPNASQISPPAPSTLISPSPTASFFTTGPDAFPPSQTMNLGAFRSYEPMPEVNGHETKKEDTGPAPFDFSAVPRANSAMGDDMVTDEPAEPAAPPEQMQQVQQQEMPPPAAAPKPPKLKLNFGGRKPSTGPGAE